jgi:hypothetical protein
MQYQTEYRISEAQLRSKFRKHAHDFGIVGHCNAQSLAEFKSAIEALLEDSNVKVIVGTFRRHRPVIYYFEPNTRLTVMLSVGSSVSCKRNGFWKPGTLEVAEAEILKVNH